MVGDAAKAEDLVQETYLRALASPRPLDRRGSFAPWLATVARRRSIDEIRSRQRVRVVASPLDLRAAECADGQDPADQVVHQELVDRVRAAVATLSVRERQLLLRQVTHGLSLAEIADEEATSVASVRSVLARARGKLRLALEKSGPLGVAPLPRLVAAVRRRLHKVAERIEGSMPLFTGAGMQVGDLVAAAIAAAALLLAGAVPIPADATRTETGPMEMATSLSSSSAPRQPTAAGPEDDSDADDPGDPGPPPTYDEPSILDDIPDDIDMPRWPSDGSDEPEEVFVENIVSSDDGSVLFMSGGTVATYSPMLFRSDDQGRSWQQVDSNVSLGPLLMAPNYSADPTLFVVSDSGLLRSRDGGRNFSPVAPARGVGTLSPGYATGDRRVVVALPSLMEYRDSDLGTTNPSLASPLLTETSGVAFAPNDPTGSSFLVTGARKDPVQRTSAALLYRCTRTGCGANPVSLGNKTSLRSSGLLVSHSVPGLVVTWLDDRLYRSSDGGSTFTVHDIPADLGNVRIQDGGAGELFLAGYNSRGAHATGLFRSLDGGLTWTGLGAGTALEKGATTAVRLSSGHILAGTHLAGGVLCSADDGVTWSPRCP